MSGFWEKPDDYAYSIDSGHGSAHSVSSNSEKEDIIEELRRTVEEVTRKPVQRDVRRIGFL